MTDGPQDGEGSSIWDRLRRRKVVQWSLGYAAGAWGLLQGLQFLSDAFEWSSRVLKLGTVAALLGLPLVVTAAWFRGERGAQNATRTELAVVTLLFLLGGGLFWQYHRSVPATDSSGPAASSIEPAAITPAADAGPSVAVLPFDNRSAKEEDGFFVDGVHDDILTQLSKISALKVISRTSVERFRNTEIPIKEIATQLGVTAILEGGVQRGGDRVRINVQLIDAATDTHLWAETYDRELTAANIFAIQSEVAEAIAGALKTALTTDEKARVVAVPTQDLEAWEAYQLGRQLAERRTSESLTEAERFLRKAIELDPAFALAYAQLAEAYILQVDYSGAPREASFANAAQAAAKALELDANLPEAWMARGSIAWYRDESDSAERLLRRAIELNPNYATAEKDLSLILRDQGRLDECLGHAERAVRLDPLSANINRVSGEILEQVGRFDEAAARYGRAIQIDPAYTMAYATLASLNAYGRNRFVDAVPLGERALALDPGNPQLHGSLALLWLDLNDEVQAGELVGTTLRRWPESLNSNSVAAAIAESRGDHAAAERYARKALAQYTRDTSSLTILSNADRRRGTLNDARARYAAAFPELLDAAGPRVNSANVWTAIVMAAVLQELGETDRAATLLDASEQTLGGMPRLGLGGYGILDVYVHALRGNKAKALAALREAERAGWRGPLWRYYRDIDPSLDSIRDEPEFKAVFADIERDVERQHAELAKRPKDAPLDLHRAS